MVRDIGSIFYQLHSGDPEYDQLPKLESNFFDNDFSFFYSGRHGIHSILEQISKTKTIRTIWLPSYFCHNVINSVNSKYNNLRFYRSQPFTFNEPSTIPEEVNKNDVILLNNYWGLKTFDYSIHSSEKPTIIEDHSHGWLSEACINSHADYCISSIRKSYPIPLGAVVWRPNNGNLNTSYIEDKKDNIHRAFDLLEEAQLLKRQYIKNENLNVQSKFLKLLNEGEALVSKSTSIVKPHSNLTSKIEDFFTLNPNKAKQRNLDFLITNLKSSDHFKIILNEGQTPFGLLLLFKDNNTFSGFKQKMIFKNIYPANLWPNNDKTLHKGLFFNIHIDFRYSLTDMEYLANTINNWVIKN